MENVILSPIRLDELQSLVADSIKDALVNHSASLATPPPRIVDGETLERELDITRQTLGRWRREKRIPYIQAGGVIRYDFMKVIDALEKKKGGTR